uniref:Nephrocystin 3-like N-terminal domain-containing protein n=1 Tax=Fusarium oxysporum (strain Fo5176) TaxID=660025 RepID=A0A0D2XKT6_FUSOF
MAAARAMLDEEHVDCPRQANDMNSYVLGSIKNHNVVIACLPTDQYGTNNAASVLSNMRRTFLNIEIGLMVGIGGAVPLKADIRLGDIVVGVRVMQYDMGKTQTRKMRVSTDPVIHYGGIGSANTVMKDSNIRNEISRELDVLCFEMEAAGLMDIMPCLPIRGICDYSDSHKAKEWQRYAAATAAAYAYEFLELWRGDSLASYAGYQQPPPEHFMVSQRHEEILKSLNFEEIDVRKSIIKAAHSKTCRWFLKHTDYLSWIDPQQVSQHHGFLWIRGKPGAGKSTIMKFIYSESKKKDRKTQSLTASFFFNARGGLLEKTVSGMYRSLLLQLFHGFPDLECVLDDPDLLPRNQNGCPPLNVLKDLLRAAVAKLGQRSFKCFIDALDECDEQQVMDLVEYFEDLAEQCTEENVNFHVCFSSRHYPYIDIKFGIRIILEEQIGHTSDLESFIKTHLRIKDRSLLAELQEKMLEKAAGVFLWVVLVVDMLNQENCRGRLGVMRRLEEVPSGLSDLFKDLLQRDTTNMEELQLSLLWILLSNRPLKPEEYYHAIWSGLYMKRLADPDIPAVDMEDSEDCFARCVISSSKGLAEITKVKQPRVQFIHESVRDFLVKDKGLNELWPELGPDWESVGHDRLKLCCYCYFGIVVAEHRIIGLREPNYKLPQGTEKCPFLEYASQFVLYHSELAANTADQQLFLENFPTSRWKPVVNAFERFKVRKYSRIAELLYILADRGCSSLIRTRLKTDSVVDTHSTMDRYAYPLIAAMAKGEKDSVAALLGFAPQDQDGITITKSLLPNIDAGGSGRSPLAWACEQGYLEIAKLLAARGANPDGEFWKPLILASKNGHTAIARWLIDHGADVHAECLKETAISLASMNGHTETVELLLNSGADPDALGAKGDPILYMAVTKSHGGVVKLLLERGAYVESKDSTGMSLLSLAATKRGSDTIMEVLLRHRADVNSRDNNGGTPLFYAVRWASVDGIKLLIRSGADVEARNKDNETCLQMAMLRGNEVYEVVRILLEHGARIDAPTAGGETCLHCSR